MLKAEHRNNGGSFQIHGGKIDTKDRFNILLNIDMKLTKSDENFVMNELRSMLM